MEHVAANIIAGATVLITVGFFVWFGVRAARRDKQYPLKIEYLDDGFVYHDAFGDTKVRWQDISSVEVKLEMHKGYAQRYSYGKTSKIWVLEIAAADESLLIFPHDFEKVSFDQFITMLQQRVYGSNQYFRGIVGDVDKFRENIPKPDFQAQMEADAFDQQIASRIAALGHPASMKEINIIIEEVERERKQEQFS